MPKAPNVISQICEVGGAVWEPMGTIGCYQWAFDAEGILSCMIWALRGGYMETPGSSPHMTWCRPVLGKDF